MNKTAVTRRAACAAIGGIGIGALLSDGSAEAAAPRRRSREETSGGMPVYENSNFYGPDGKFDAEAGRRVYLQFLRHLGYPTPPAMEKNLYVTDCALGRFAEVGMGCFVFIDDKPGNYAAIEVVLLPNQQIPEHWHEPIEAEKIAPKMESWYVRYGSTFVYGEGEPVREPAAKVNPADKPFLTVWHETILKPGEVTGVTRPLAKHWQQAGPQGVVLTEVATYHSGAAVRFTNPKIKM